MAEIKTSQIFETLDLYIASYLSFCGNHPTFKIQNSRVAFSFPATDDLYKLIRNYNANINIPICDFVTTIKMLRGQMINLRNSNQNKKGWVHDWK
ncbi:MAG: hypothetical protein A2W22_06940 [Candidatus Levybacteria bacterium RBG_16_35_11]|nr:MAG: hypothetical protein A2W22_06940 [Candidatus Levybacteria bacterium RBG_16_35_11]